MTTALAFRLFLEPMPLDDYWLVLLVPLAIVIAVVYKTIKLDDLAQLPSQAVYLATQILLFMVLAAAALWLVTELA